MIALNTALTQVDQKLRRPEQGLVISGLEIAQTAVSEPVKGPVTFGLLGKVLNLPASSIFRRLRRKQSPSPSRPVLDTVALAALLCVTFGAWAGS
jgi:hypothetical protein